jgi:heptosyltransferase-2
MSRRSVLIIKLGYSETFVPQVRNVCSLGDVLRTTCLLHLFKGDEVTWLTDPAAVPILRGTPLIGRIVEYGAPDAPRLEAERFDVLVNLEKVPEICELAGRIDAGRRHGFRLDPDTGRAVACSPDAEALVVTTHAEARQLHGRPWAELLYAMLGVAWKGEPCVLGYRPRGEAVHDIGFNTHVGSLLPVKAWPQEHWRRLEQLIGGRWSVSHQQCLHNLEGYMDWVHSCRLLVTCDSLGLHLALAMGKPVVALFGPTPPDDIMPQPRLRVLTTPVRRECIPCLRPECAVGDPCMRHIAPEAVWEAVQTLMTEGRS